VCVLISEMITFCGKPGNVKKLNKSWVVLGKNHISGMICSVFIVHFAFEALPVFSVMTVA